MDSTVNYIGLNYDDTVINFAKAHNITANEILAFQAYIRDSDPDEKIRTEKLNVPISKNAEYALMFSKIYEVPCKNIILVYMGVIKYSFYEYIGMYVVSTGRQKKEYKLQGYLKN